MRRLLLLFVLVLPLTAQNALWVDVSGEWRLQTGDDPRYAARDLDDHAWRTVTIKGLAGVGSRQFWMRRRVTLPAGADFTRLALTLGALRDGYEVFVNGQRIGATDKFRAFSDAQLAQPRTYAIPPGAAEQTLQIAVRVHRFLAVPPPWRIPDQGPYAITDQDHPPTFAAKAQFNALALQNLPQVAVGMVMFGIALLSLIAWLSDRSRREFLWFSLYAFCFAAERFEVFARIAPDTLPFNDAGGTPLHTFLQALGWPLLGEFAMAALGSSWRTVWRLLLGGAFFITMAYAVSGQVDFLYYGSVFRSVALCGLVLTNWRRWWTSWEHRLLSLATLLYGLSTFEDFLRRILRVPNLAPAYLSLGQYRVSRIDLLAVVLAVLILTMLLRRLNADRREKQRLAAEFEAAGVIQRLLLKDATLRESGLTLDAVYVPAQEVGGDFYYVLDGEVVVVGDVSGKGLKAAMLVSLLIGVLRDTAERDPARVLSALNRALSGQLEGGFVTCCCARFGADGAVIVASAGHPSPYVDGVESIVETGLPLGLEANASYAETTLRLGSSLTLASDGVVEAENAQRVLFGFDRMREISTQSAAIIADAARAWGQNDDITVVTVRRIA